jgi:hypothetical protein
MTAGYFGTGIGVCLETVVHVTSTWYTSISSIGISLAAPVRQQ